MNKRISLRSQLARFMLMIFAAASLPSCGVAPTEIPAAPTLSPTPTCTPTVVPTATLIPPTATMTLTPIPLSVAYNQRFLSALPKADESCLPDKTKDDLGIYIYDLNKNQELISINADMPFQFASAFKGPVLVYFLSQCGKYWDAESPEWNAYFSDLESARNIERYVSPEYLDLLARYLADINHWDYLEKFATLNRFDSNGIAGIMDKRFFMLEKVYSMATRSNNSTTGEVLKFVYEHCEPLTESQIAAQDCYQPNAISAFNQWFNAFAKIQYENGETQRGLFKWDVVIEKNADGQPYDAKMATYGLEDQCAMQTARLSCSADYGANVWTAKDFFQFYNALYHSSDTRVRDTALAILSIDNLSPARGNLKNLARKMGAVSMSKNGHAHFIHGSINTDAGIFYVQNTAFVIVVLGYDAQNSLSLLYGDYTPEGDPLIDQSLIRDLLVEYLAAP